MRVRFCCVAFVPPDTQLGVTGDPEFLGKWDPKACVRLIPHSAPAKGGTEPSLWFADVDLDERVVRELSGSAHQSDGKTLPDCGAFREQLLACLRKHNPPAEDGKKVKGGRAVNSVNTEETWLPVAASRVDHDATDVATILEQHPLRHASFEYKFILWSTASPPTPYVPEVPGEAGETGTCAMDGRVLPSWRTWLFPPAPAHRPQPPAAEACVIWEGSGASSNRKFVFDPYDVVVDQCETGEPVVLYMCKIAQFVDPRVMDASECSHTTRFYNLVKTEGRMHYSRILPNLFVGSCPRQLKHIQHLKNDLGVTAVFNLQTADDIRVNYPDANATNRSPELVCQMYDSNGISYVWTPIEDMSNTSRKLAAAQCALILNALLQNGHTVYVHCNAGVGRSVATVSAYLCFCLSMDVRKANFFVVSRRPVAYWDEDAMKYGRSDYRSKFGRLSV